MTLILKHLADVICCIVFFLPKNIKEENNILHEMKATNRDGADAETVVCALFHDVGEVLNHVNHGEIG